MKYDDEGKNILDAYESGTMKLYKPSKKEIESIKAAAQKLFPCPLFYSIRSSSSV